VVASILVQFVPLSQQNSGTYSVAVGVMQTAGLNDSSFRSVNIGDKFIVSTSEY